MSFKLSPLSLQLSAFCLSVLLFGPAQTFAAEFDGTLKEVKITDSSGTNQPPTAVLTYTQSGSTFTFDASGSSDPDGTIAEYKWDFGDGSTATGITASHQFPAGTHNVTLMLIDSNGGAALVQQKINATVVVYENAEDGTIIRWSIYDNDPPATITNVFDNELKSNVIDLKGDGDGTNNGFQLLSSSGTIWQNSNNFIIEWKMKFAAYKIYVDVMTNAGQRYLIYRPLDYDALGTAQQVTFGVGSITTNGQWHNIERNLQNDLNKAQPGVEITEVNGFLVRGSGRLDDILLK